ncbi:MAG: substrate-binding domain-containing protein [Thermomicrobiales bacterium]
MDQKVGRRLGGPMYQQVRQDLLAQIRRGEFKPGDRIPSENQLCARYAVSITTARRAMLELEREGIVERRIGVGTMVAPHVRPVRLALMSIGYVGESLRRVSSPIGDLVAGITDYAGQRHMDLGMSALQYDEVAAYVHRFAKDRPADGLLIRTPTDIDAEIPDLLDDAGIPYVIIKRYVPGRPSNCVISDDLSGSWLATTHLLSLGHRRVGFVCATQSAVLSRDRLAGYRKALAEQGLPRDDALIRQEADFSAESGYRAVAALLRLTHPPTAIFVASDTMAVGAYDAARDCNRIIPDNLAIVGYDDLSLAMLLRPALTTIRTSRYDFGRLSAELLLDLIEGRKRAPQQQIIPSMLIVRESAMQTHPAGGERDHRAASAIHREPREGPRPGRLAERVIVTVGTPDPAGRSIADACLGEGATWVECDVPIATDDAFTHALGPHGHADVLICHLDMHTPLAELTQRTSTLIRAAAPWLTMGGRMPTVLLIAPFAGGIGDADSLTRAVVQAGLQQATKTLADEWAARGIRVNALLDMDGAHDLSGPAVFLASGEAAMLSGVTLAKHG